MAICVSLGIAAGILLLLGICASGRRPEDEQQDPAHQLLGIDGYIYKQARCSCGWAGHEWNARYIEMDREAKANATREWDAHKGSHV